MLANLPGVGYESAPRRFRETRSTIPEWQDSLIELRVAQFNTAQERPPGRVAANMDNVQEGAPSRLGVIAFCPNEKERTHVQAELAYSCSTTLKREVLI